MISLKEKDKEEELSLKSNEESYSTEFEVIAPLVSDFDFNPEKHKLDFEISDTLYSGIFDIIKLNCNYNNIIVLRGI